MITKPLHRLLPQALGLVWLWGGLVAPSFAALVTVQLDWAEGYDAKDSSGTTLTTGSTVQLGWFTGVTDIASTVTRSNLNTYFTTFASTNFLGVPVGGITSYEMDGDNTTVDSPADPATKTTLYMVISSGANDLGVFKWRRSTTDFAFPRNPADYPGDASTVTTQVTGLNNRFNTIALIGTATATGLTLANTGGGSTPTLGSIGSLAALTTTYGTASSLQSVNITGANLTGNVLATAPTGIQVSSDGAAFGSTATFLQSGGSVSGTLFVRLAATSAVSGSYDSQNIVLSSSGATSVNVATAASGNSVAAKALTISGLAATDKDVDGTTTVSVTGTPSYEGLVNGETFSVSGTVTWAFPDAAVGSGKTLSRTGSFGAPSANYSVTQPTLTASIRALPALRLLSLGSPVYTNGNTTITHTFAGNPSATYVLEYKSRLTNAWVAHPVAVGSSTNFSVTLTNSGSNSTNEWKNGMFFRVKNG